MVLILRLQEAVVQRQVVRVIQAPAVLKEYANALLATVALMANAPAPLIRVVVPASAVSVH